MLLYVCIVSFALFYDEVINRVCCCVWAYHWRTCAVSGGVMSIQSERARASADGFWMQLPKEKYSRFIFSIGLFDRSAHHHQLLNSNLFAGWRWDINRRVFTALRIITNHTRFCWAYECKDQSEAFRWVIAETLTRWLNTSFWWILLEATKCRCVYESVRY